MTRLFIFPEVPSARSGYQIAVRSDISRIKLRPTDQVVFYSVDKTYQTPYPIIPKRRRLSWSRFSNLFKGRVSSELRPCDLKEQLGDKKFDVCFCGDVIVYNAAKKLYPNARFYVRFHNFFTLSLNRNKKHGYKLGLLAYLNVKLLSRLEYKIIKDRSVFPIFITQEEASYFHTLFPHRKYKVWEILKPIKQSAALVYPTTFRLVWFGGVSSHKKFGLDYFVKNVYSNLHQRYGSVELHLFGAGTQTYTNTTKNIHGHGFYKGTGVPFEGNALFVNPDLLGGGVKLKVAPWLESGLSFISTPYGIEGYRIQTAENILIENIDQWEERIIRFFKNRNLV